MTLHARRRGFFQHWSAALWLAVVWTLLWGDLTVGNVLSGLIVGLVVTYAFPLPAIGFHVRLRPWSFLVLAGYFLAELVTASFQVASQALNPKFRPRGAVVGVKLRNPADLYLTITAELSSLVPGSLVIEAHRLTGMIYLHVLDLESHGGPDKVRQHTLDLEARVLRAMATDDELARAGLTRSARAPQEVSA